MGNLIQVTDKYAIGSDDKQWFIAKPVKQKDKESGEAKETWQPSSYFSNIDSAVRELGQTLLRTGDYYSIDDLVCHSIHINALLNEKFTSQIEVK